MAHVGQQLGLGLALVLGQRLGLLQAPDQRRCVQRDHDQHPDVREDRKGWFLPERRGEDHHHESENRHQLTKKHGEDANPETEPKNGEKIKTHEQNRRVADHIEPDGHEQRVGHRSDQHQVRCRQATGQARKVPRRERVDDIAEDTRDGNGMPLHGFIETQVVDYRQHCQRHRNATLQPEVGLGPDIGG